MSADTDAWRCVSWCARAQLVDHPRVIRMVQVNVGEVPVVTFHVEGLAQVYHSTAEALAASEANPCS
jgi:hypothetical protein